MVFSGIAIDANREATAIMMWILIAITSKSNCGLNRNPALRIDKYPLCPAYGTRFQTQVRIQILHLTFMNYFSHHVLTNYSFYIFLCQQNMFSMPFSSFWMLRSLPLFLKLLTYLDPLVSNTLPRICCQLTPALYHWATEDLAHVLLFVYLCLNLVWNF